MCARGVYPASAYAPTGEPWWRLLKHPGSNRTFGDERRIAAWLAFNVREGETFTMRDLRRELGTGQSPNAKEQLNRRLRSLRRDGWVVRSYRDSDLPADTYRLQRIGWHPGLGVPRRPQQGLSARTRRYVLERDGRRCVVCNVGAGEPYDVDDSRRTAVLTVGHRVPGQRATSDASPDDLQTECQRCNEPVRDELVDPPTLAEVWPALRRLTRPERDALYRWIAAGRRLKSRLDEAYDVVRSLTPSEREEVARELAEMLGYERR